MLNDPGDFGKQKRGEEACEPVATGGNELLTVKAVWGRTETTTASRRGQFPAGLRSRKPWFLSQVSQSLGQAWNAGSGAILS